MNKRSKIKTLLLFPDGVGIRNYLYTDVFNASDQDLILFHNFDEDTIKEVSKITGINDSIRIPIYKETIKEKFLRELICLLRLKNNTELTKNETLLTNWKTNHKDLKNIIFYKGIEFCSLFVKKYKEIISLEKKYQVAIRKTKYYQEIRTLLKNIEPDVLFCAHQRGVQCATIFAAAKDLGIKTSTVIYSWDNLPKARLALRANQYLVWSEYMKSEMQMYYPEISSDKVKVTGTPQFDCYKDSKNIISKNEFYEKYNLDLNKKIICFSGDDVLTSPDDPKYLNDLAVEILKNGLEQEYQILFRRCPVDVSGRYNQVIEKYSDLIKEAPPLWNFDKSRNWTTIYPLKEDVRLLVSTVYYCDVVVNVGSTMAFDFAMFQKPCIFINYDQKVKFNTNWSVNTIYKFQHFRSMKSPSSVLWWNKKEQIAELLNKKANLEAMNDWKELILSENLNTTTVIQKAIKS